MKIEKISLAIVSVFLLFVVGCSASSSKNVVDSSEEVDRDIDPITTVPVSIVTPGPNEFATGLIIQKGRVKTDSVIDALEDREKTQRLSTTLDVQCELFSLEHDYFEKYDFEIPNNNGDEIVMTDIETYFFLQYNGQKRPRWTRVDAGARTMVFDDLRKNGKEFPLIVSAKDGKDGDCNLMSIAAPSDSRFILKESKTIRIPNGGSLFLRSEADSVEGKSYFVWLKTYNVVNEESN